MHAAGCTKAVGMRTRRPTIDYVRRRTAEGKGKREVIRRLKRFVAREILGHLRRRTGAIHPARTTARLP
jgi:transposase